MACYAFSQIHTSSLRPILSQSNALFPSSPAAVTSFSSNLLHLQFCQRNSLGRQSGYGQALISSETASGFSFSTQTMAAVERRCTFVFASLAGVLLGPSIALAEPLNLAGEAADPVTDKVITILFVAAVLGLSILTIGVAYLSITDFLEKRENESQKKNAVVEKKTDEEATVSSRSGAKGFGQRIKKKNSD